MKKSQKGKLSLFLVLLLTASCVLSGIIANAETGDEHTHSDSCYATAGALKCTLEETVGHTHSAECYTTVDNEDGTTDSQELTCGKAETAGHTHSSECYYSGGELICGKEETKDQSGDNDANKETNSQNPNIMQETHVHSEACYDESGQLICGQTTESGQEDTDPDEDAVAAIGQTGYDTLQAAIDAVNEGETILLLKDVAENISSQGKSYILDMNNHTINPSGGAVYYISGGSVTLKNGTLSGGSGSSGCGLFVSNANFTGNYLTVSGNTSAGFGAVYVTNSQITLNNSEISNNRSGYYGGGICLSGSSLEGNHLTVSNNSFYVNGYGNKYWYGGAIYLKDSASSARLENSVFSENDGYQGGAIYAKGNLSLKGCTITGNTSSNKGGGIYSVGDLSMSDGCIVSGNQSSSYGGIYAGGSDLTITGCTISKNSANNCGGITAEADNTEISNTEITGNTGKNSCGGLSVGQYSGTAKLTKVTVDGNSAPKQAAANFSISGSAVLLAESCQFNQNKGQADGSIIFMTSSSKDRTFADCQFTGNRGADQTIEIFNGSVNFDRCKITDNTAVLAGAVFCDNNQSIINLKDSVVKNNTATGNDANAVGGIYINSGALNMESGAVYGNLTNGSGKANDLYIAAGQNVTIIAANTMSDTETSEDFSNYIWFDQQNGIKYTDALTADEADRCLSAVLNIVRDVAQIGETKYESLESAVNAAQPNDRILLIAGENDEYGTAFAVGNVVIDKAITIDVNGRTLKNMNPQIFTVKEKGVLTIEGTGTIKGTAVVEAGGSLLINGRCGINSIIHNGELLQLNSSFDKLSINLSADKFITIGENFTCNSLEIALDGTILQNFNDENTITEDIILAQGVVGDLADKVTIKGLTNYFVKVQCENGNLILHKGTAEGVFVDGENGSDDADGSYEHPVKTFDKAAEIMNTVNSDKNNTADENFKPLDTIYVLGQITVSDEQSWSLDGKTLARYPRYTGRLVLLKDKGSLTLQNIVMDGGSNYGITDAKSLIEIDGSATLSIGENAVLQNNYTHNSAQMSFGGAVYVTQKGSVQLAGGTIQNCSATYGGGICCLGVGKTVLNSGIISGCKTVNSRSYEGIISGVGGGVCVAYNGNLEMNGGTVSGNTAERGGGIAVGTPNLAMVKGYNPRFQMNGGTISDNISNNVGGGIYVECSSNAVVSGGNISDNTAGGGQFGGGGIYINGGRQSYGVENGCLQLYNVIITDNTANYNGGGVAACPTSDVKIYLNRGGAIYENTAEQAEDIFATSGTMGVFSGNANVFVSEYMLGGGLNNWVYGKGSVSEGLLIPINLLHDNSSINARNGHSGNDAEITAANSLAKVIISGNKAAESGGGIGTNGDLIIGDEPEDTVDISVSKTWNDEGKENLRPDYVLVWLYQNGNPLYFVKLSPDVYGNWDTVQFTKQPACDNDGHKYEYTIKEDPVNLADRYQSAVSGDGENGFTVTNTLITTGSLTVIKTVSGSSASTSKEFTFTVELSDTSISGRFGDMTFENGIAVFTLKDGESKTAADLPENITYTVKESNNSGYTVTVNGTDQITASGTITAGKTNTEVFNNHKGGGSSAGPAKVILKAKKILDNKAPVDNSFNFLLKDENGKLIQTVSNRGGEITFDALSFQKAGTYIYYITEEAGDSSQINYDKTAYKVIITVTKSGNYKAYVIYEKDGQKYEGIPLFVNTTNGSENIDDGKISVSVSKVWQSDNGTVHPDSIGVQLYRNGIAYGAAVTLNGDNGWQYTWTGLDSNYNWTVDEVNSPAGYDKTITNTGTDWLITNIANLNQPSAPDNPNNPGQPNNPNQPNDPDHPNSDEADSGEPQTGDSSHTTIWLLMMAAAGICLLLLIGYQRCREEKR